MSDARTRPLDDAQLHHLADEELIEHMRAARESGDLDRARVALQVLVFGYLDHVRARVALKVPEHAVDEVAGHALVSAVAGAFRGGSIGEFRAWLHVIVSRRIADYHRAGKLELVPLDDAQTTTGGDDTEGALPVENVVEVALAELNDVHRRVIELHVLEGLTAAETASELRAWRPDRRPPISPDNVHKIAQRFRERVRAQLEDSDG